ncbi:hypothetical protein ABM90_17065 [Rhodococcus erythropolis]|nr:hypothetical protein ABM90_17065 [Rhodococcus erythropolis]
MPVVGTELGRDHLQCGGPLSITVLEFYSSSPPELTGRRESFVDCRSGCKGVIEQPVGIDISRRPTPGSRHFAASDHQRLPESQPLRMATSCGREAFAPPRSAGVIEMNILGPTPTRASLERGPTCTLSVKY